MLYRASAYHHYLADIYQEHMLGPAKSQQYCQPPKQVYSRKGGSSASGRQVPDTLDLIA